ncbi:MAG: TAXI family TRAP transporter solute-binding subunit [Gammaproteobacteria bacterium]|nr:TAXI family TRAP transporter solute-binding subunit [Gammaproteobacteria bacterium]
MKNFLLILFLLLLAGCSQSEIGQNRNITLCGASPSGLWSLLGTGIDAAMKASYPDATVTYQTSGGGFANVRGLQEGRCEIALIHDAEAKIAANGEPPFSEQHSNLRTIAALYNWAPLQLIVSKAFADEYQVASLEDIIRKQVPVRILLNRRGNISSQVGEALINAAGATLEEISDWGGKVTFAASDEQGDLIRDRRADAIFNSLFVGHSSILQIADAIDVVLLPVSGETANKVADEFGIIPYTIPRGAYEWNNRDVLTVSLSAHLFALESYPEKRVQELATALLTNLDHLQMVHTAMQPLNSDLMISSNTIPYHTGAIAAYTLAGIMQ